MLISIERHRFHVVPSYWIKDRHRCIFSPPKRSNSHQNDVNGQTELVKITPAKACKWSKVMETPLCVTVGGGVTLGSGGQVAGFHG